MLLLASDYLITITQLLNHSSTEALAILILLSLSKMLRCVSVLGRTYFCDHKFALRNKQMIWFLTTSYFFFFLLQVALKLQSDSEFFLKSYLIVLRSWMNQIKQLFSSEVKMLQDPSFPSSHNGRKMAESTNHAIVKYSRELIKQRL